MILVAGATGLVGSEVCLRLRQRGEPVRALVRATSSKDRVETLASSGVELCVGDLKDPHSIAAACRGVDGVISTASTTMNRQPGDSIESVDAVGQLNLVKAAIDANVNRFIFVSFRRTPGLSFPLADAKEHVENAISWVSYRDVAEICAIAFRHPAAERRTIEFGGPEALSPLEVVTRFERIGGRSFRLEHISEETLLAQFAGATDSMQKSFAALMLGYAHGDVMNMASVVDTFGIRLSSVDEYARSVLGKVAAA